jgi:cyanophycinase-like exopeptidase
MAQSARDGSRTRTFLLMGSGEFEPWSRQIESDALHGRAGYVAVLPTASSAEGGEVFARWGRMALEHYAASGLEARLLPVKTREDAEREDHAREVEGAAMVFFSGGKPQHLASTIHGTRLWDALTIALDDGTVFAGCSAGALVASQSRGQRRDRGARTGWVFGLGLVPHVSFGVHWDKVKVIPGLRSLTMSRTPSGSWFVGLDERTAILGDGHRWRVYGLGSVMVRHGGGTEIHREGATFETMDRGGPPAGD